MTQEKLAELGETLIGWYLRHARDLPWRHTRDPYRIWLSEVILQQTRVDQGLPYYQRFVDRFPDPESLAAAPVEEVLRLWQGLGYYTRGRNLHRCAREIVQHHGGRFPESYTALLALPGVGPYTAAAIASFAFGIAVPVVDGNVLRFLSRLHGIGDDIGLPATRKKIETLARGMMPPDRAGLFNQAIMEFGALHCTPSAPRCGDCPFSDSCVALARGLQAELPRKSPARPRRDRWFYYLVFRHRGLTALGARPGGDIWTGLYEYYLVEAPGALGDDELRQRAQSLLPPGARPSFGPLRPCRPHVLSHQVLHAAFLEIDLPNEDEKPDLGPEMRFYTSQQIDELPKPVLIERYRQGKLI